MAVFRVVSVFLILLMTVCAVLCDVCYMSDEDFNKKVIPECPEDDMDIENWIEVGDDCSCGVVGNLTVAECFLEDSQYIPVFPFEIDTLCISSDDLVRIKTADFFENVSSISALDIQADSFSGVNTAALKRLRNLTRLSLVLDEGKLPKRVITSILDAIPMLTALGMSKCQLSSEAWVLNNSKSLQKLEVIDLSYNLLKRVRLWPSYSLQNVRQIDLSFNLLTSVHVHTVLPNLKELILGQNSLQSFPDSCTKSGESYLPNLETLALDLNKIPTMPKQLCLPRLRLLILDGNNFMNTDLVSLTGVMFPNLVYASFLNMIFRNEHMDFMFSDMPSLECVDLGRNAFFYIKELTEMFANCSRLRYLDISENFIENGCENSTCLLGPQQSLQHVEHLNLSQCDLGSSLDASILSTFISIMPNLVLLDVSDNNIHFIPSGFFDGLLKLRYLYLHLNYLAVVSQDMFSARTRGRLETLHIAFNPFVCTCDILWFKSWIASSPNTFVDTKDYWCFEGGRIRDVPLLDFKVSEQACLMSHAAYVAITYITLFMLLFAVATVSFWRYKWHLRLWLYIMFRGPGDARRLRLQHGHFDYDVFVSYDSDDQLWVFGKLVPELEGRLGLKLCVHERDFVPGTQIIDNIAKCVEASKKILMVWSRHFVDSKWCQFELTFCLQHAMDTEDALVIVCLDDVTSTKDITPAMMAVLKTTTYIQWVGEGLGQEALDSFWGRLRVALQEVMPDHEHQV